MKASSPRMLNRSIAADRREAGSRARSAAKADSSWLEPTLAVEVTYSEIMEGRLRDPVYRGVV